MAQEWADLLRDLPPKQAMIAAYVFGRYACGDRGGLPTVRALAEQLDVSKSLVGITLKRLVAIGVLVTTEGETRTRGVSAFDLAAFFKIGDWTRQDEIDVGEQELAMDESGSLDKLRGVVGQAIGQAPPSTNGGSVGQAIGQAPVRKTNDNSSRTNLLRNYAATQETPVESSRGGGNQGYLFSDSPPRTTPPPGSPALGAIEDRNEKSGSMPDAPAASGLNAEIRPPSGKRPPQDVRDAVERLWALQEQLRRQVIPGSSKLKLNDDRRARVLARLWSKKGEAMATEAECEAVLREVARRCERDRSNWDWFNGVTNWRPDNFDRILGSISARGTEAASIMTGHPARPGTSTPAPRPIARADDRVYPPMPDPFAE